MIRAIHILSTAPSRAKLNKNEEFVYEPFPFEVVCTVLSALMWRKLNGPIRFHVDSHAYEFYKKHDLLDAWDDGVEISVMDNLPKNIDPRIFWASSKMFALQSESCPVAMIDTDLIIWKNINDILNESSLTVLHREGLTDCYVDKVFLKIRSGYKFDPSWDWKVLPCNTALAYFKDDGFKNYYLDKSIDFMTGNLEPAKENISQMVFAEQRILPMCAKQKGVKINALIDDPFQEGNDTFTHLWGAKEVARKSREQNARLISAMMNKIRSLDEKMHDKLYGSFFGKNPDAENLMGEIGKYIN